MGFRRCTLVGDLVPGSLGGVWLVDIVDLPMGLQTPSALTSSLGSLHHVLWLAACIHINIGQALAEPLRRQQYQRPVSKCFWESAIMSGIGICRYDSAYIYIHTHTYTHTHTLACMCVCMCLCVCMCVFCT